MSLFHIINRLFNKSKIKDFLQDTQDYPDSFNNKKNLHNEENISFSETKDEDSFNDFIHDAQEKWKKILKDEDEENKEINEAQQRWKNMMKEDKGNSVRRTIPIGAKHILCIRCGMQLPPEGHKCAHTYYNEIEHAPNNEVAELIYQGFLDFQDDEYIEEELYYFVKHH